MKILTLLSLLLISFSANSTTVMKVKQKFVLLKMDFPNDFKRGSKVKIVNANGKTVGLGIVVKTKNRLAIMKLAAGKVTKGLKALPYSKKKKKVVKRKKPKRRKVVKKEESFDDLEEDTYNNESEPTAAQSSPTTNKDFKWFRLGAQYNSESGDGLSLKGIEGFAGINYELASIPVTIRPNLGLYTNVASEVLINGQNVSLDEFGITITFSGMVYGLDIGYIMPLGSFKLVPFFGLQKSSTTVKSEFLFNNEDVETEQTLSRTTTRFGAEAIFGSLGVYLVYSSNSYSESDSDTSSTQTLNTSYNDKTTSISFGVSAAF